MLEKRKSELKVLNDKFSVVSREYKGLSEKHITMLETVGDVVSKGKNKDSLLLLVEFLKFRKAHLKQESGDNGGEASVKPTNLNQIVSRKLNTMI